MGKAVYIIAILLVVACSILVYDIYNSIYNENEYKQISDRSELRFLEANNESNKMEIQAVQVTEPTMFGINCGRNYTALVNSSFIGCVKK